MTSQNTEAKNKNKNKTCSWVRRLNVKMLVLPDCRLNTISIKLPESYFGDLDELILKFIQKSKRPSVTNTIQKKNKIERLTIPDFQLYYKATVIKTGCEKNSERIDT